MLPHPRKMIWARFILFSISLFSLSLAAPAQNHDLEVYPHIKRAAPNPEQIGRATSMFPGIDWSMTATEGGCDSGQFNILVEATRMALEMMTYTGQDMRVAYDKTGFNRYFMRTPEWFKLRIWEMANGIYTYAVLE
jgi:hypothetical protein